MFQVDQCCCCVELEAGCKVLGIIGVISSSFGLLGAIIAGHGFSIFIHILNLLICIALLYGAMRRNTIAIGAFLIADALGIVITVIFIIYISIRGGDVIEDKLDEINTENPLEGKILNHEKEVVRASVIGVVIGFCILLSISIYFWIVVFSYFKRISAGPSLATA